MGLRKKRRTPIFWETSLGIPLRTGFIGRFVSRARKNGCWFGFDFHSPWHIGNKNDNAFIVQNSIEKLPRLNRFGKLLEESMTGDSFKYEHKNDYPPETGWNNAGNQFAIFMTERAEDDIAFTLETAYFGTAKNRADNKSLTELGRCFAAALKKYIGSET